MLVLSSICPHYFLLITRIAVRLCYMCILAFISNLEIWSWAPMLNLSILFHIGLFIFMIRLNWGSWWRRSCISCSLRLSKLHSLFQSMEVLTTSSCWRRTSNSFRSHPQWRNATSCPSNCFTLVLLGYSSFPRVILTFEITFYLVLVGFLKWIVWSGIIL